MPEDQKAEDIMERLEQHLQLDDRVDRLEDRMTVVEQCVQSFTSLPDILTDLRILVEGKFSALATQSKITWALLLVVITGLLGLVWAYLAR